MIAYDSLSIIDVTDGRGISRVANYYYATETNTETLPNIGDTLWKIEVSELTNVFGETYKYLWNYEVVLYDDGTNGDPTTPVLIGVYSKDGNGIIGIIEYYLATKTNEPPKSLPTADNANGWTKDDGKTVLPQASKDSPYLWNYEIIDYTDGSDTTSGPVCIDTYTDSVYTWIKYADDINGTNMSDTQQVGQWYIGVAYNKDTPNPSSDPKDYIWSLIPDEPTDVIGVPQYYLKAIPGEEEDLEAPDQDDEGWSDDCPNPWASECLDGDGKSLYYVWQRTKTKRTNGISEKCQYTTPTVLSDYEVANILAQQAGYKSVGEWCKKKDITIIDGSTIMTGTISADKIDVNFVSALDLEVGNQVKMGSNAKISWNNVTNKDSVASKDDVSTAKSEAINAASDDATSKANAAQSGAISEIDGRGYQNASQVTQITKDTISTTNVVAENLVVKAANIDGTLTIGKFDQETQNKVNNSVASTTIEYALSGSSTTAPTSDWSTTAPSWEAGKYMWQRTTIAYTDSTKTPTVTITCIQGAKGETGNGINSTTVTYGVSDSASDKPTTWSSTMPTVEEGKYLWTCTTIDYTDPNKADTATYTYARQGANGTNGTNGNTPYIQDGYWYINGISIGVKAEGVDGSDGKDGKDGANGTDGQTPYVENGYWYINGTSLGIKAEGVDGKDGTNGKDGTSVTVSSIQYQAGSSSTTAPTGTWSNAVVTVSEGQYLWTKTTFSDGKIAYGVAKQGVSGKDGSGVKKINTHIREFTAADWEKYGTAGHEENWTTGSSYDNSHINIGDTAYITGVVTDVKGVNNIPVNAAIYGVVIAKVTNHVTMASSYLIMGGEKGTDGIDGKSVTKVITQYCVSTNNATAPTSGWSDNFDGVLTTYYDNKKSNPNTSYYIWSREQVSYSSGDPTYSTATVNSASSFIASWCDTNDTTKINGGNIATGTVDAKAINVTDLSAFKAKIGGWDITENGIEKGSVVGMLATTGSCRSDDKTSSPRFYAGADMATYGDNWGDHANFLVLEDGTLYAHDVNVNGYIEATDGSFAGVVDAKAGSSLGGFKVYEDSITGSNIQLLDGDSTIRAKKLYANKIGIHDGSKECFSFDMNGTTPQNVTVSVELKKDIWSSETDRYYSAFTIRLSEKATRDYSFTLFIYYYYKDAFEYEDFIQSEITIKAGSDYGNYTFQEKWTFKALFADREFTRSRLALVGEDIIWETTESSLTKTDIHTYQQLTGGVLQIHAGGHLVPTHWGGDGTGWNLGERWLMWNNIYAYTTAIQASDRQVKKDIDFLSDAHEQIFDALEPVSYKFKTNTSDRTHTGFIAQDVKAAVENAGLTTQDFAAYCEWENDDGTIGCGLRYSEFIALCVNEIQKLKKRVNELEEKLDNTK